MLSESAYTLFSKWCHWLPCWEKITPGKHYLLHAL